jgi:hypothetical protein
MARETAVSPIARSHGCDCSHTLRRYLRENVRAPENLQPGSRRQPPPVNAKSADCGKRAKRRTGTPRRFYLLGDAPRKLFRLMMGAWMLLDFCGFARATDRCWRPLIVTAALIAAITVNNDGLKSNWPCSAALDGTASAQIRKNGNRNRSNVFALDAFQFSLFWRRGPGVTPAV